MFSRRIESACKNNIQFMAISGCAQPDHSTIAAFISSMDEEIIGIFINILLRCAQLELIGGEVFANIKVHKRLDRFTLRGKKKVDVQWLLFCCVHNIGKIANCMD